MTFSLSRRLFAEFSGTAFLLAGIVGSGIMAEKLAGGNIGVALLGNTIATGAILYVIITMLGPISGAHLNPVVSAVFAARGDFSWKDAYAYIPVQILGGIAGVILANAMFGLELVQVAETARTGVGQWIGEIVATFGLVIAILLTLKFRPEAVPTAVALFVTAGYWFTSSTSFANPAVSIARCFTNTFDGIRPIDALFFIIFEIIGATIAYFVGRWLLRSET